MMKYRVYTKNYTEQSDTLSQLASKTRCEDLFKIILNVYPNLDLELGNHLEEVGHLAKEKFLVRSFHFQEKYHSPDLEIMLFKDNTEYELYAVGFEEKVVPLLNNTLVKGELLGTANSWAKQGYKCWFIATSDAVGYLVPLDPHHNQNKFVFEAIIGIKV